MVPGAVKVECSCAGDASGHRSRPTRSFAPPRGCGLTMPVLDGCGVLAAMRADPRLRAVPAVVLTSKALTPAERDYLARTAERVIEKGEYRLSDVGTLIPRAATGR